MISDEKRKELADLAMRALDAVEEYDEKAEMGEALIVFEVLTPDEEQPETGPYNHVLWRSTGEHTSVAVGLIEIAKAGMLRPVN